MKNDRINIMALAREFPRLWESSTALELYAFARICIEADREARMDMQWVDLIMQQAQVFASAWSLVGGKFDGGDMLEVAEAERASLCKMIEGVASSIAKPKVHIKQWSVKTEPFPHITGVAAGHPVLGDGPVRTSKLVSIETRNTIYVLDGEPAASEVARDTERLDFLCDHVINVRDPLRHGSRDVFLASPTDDDSGHAPSNLRALIDAEIDRLDRANAHGESKREPA